MDNTEVRREISWIGARLREPSTYAGLALVLGGLLHFGHADQISESITSIGVGIGGLIAILVPAVRD